MTRSPVRIVLAGAGHAHLVALRDLARMPRDGISVTVVTPEPESLYSGMLPGLIAGHFRREDLAIPVAPLAGACAATLVLDEVTRVDPAGKSIRLGGGGALDYDVLSIDVGSIASLSDVPGASSHAVPLRPLRAFLRALDGVERRLPGPHDPPLAVVGAGAGGVEVVLALDRRFNSGGRSSGRVPLVLVSAGSCILDGFPRAVARRFMRLLSDRGITVHAGSRVTEVTGDALRLAGGGSIAVSAAIWAGQAAPHPWLAQSGLAADDEGFVRVDRSLRAVGRDDILVVGDAASFDPRPLPKAGVHAVRQGEMLALSLTAMAAGRAPPAYRPQREALYILTTGGRHAVATRNGFSLAGHWAWLWKRHIDTRFVDRLKAAPSR